MNFKETNMSKFFLILGKVMPSVAIVSLLAMSGCSGDDGRNVSFLTFPKEIKLEGMAIHMPDSLPYVIGEVNPVGGGYWCYIYQSDKFLMAVDSAFNPTALFAHKGGGPGEITGVSGKFGQSLGDDGLFSVFDCNSVTVYGTNRNLEYQLEKVMALDSLRKYAVIGIIRLKNGSYIARRGDFSCGIVEYNPSAKAINKWPVGFSPEDQPVSEARLNELNSMDYNPERGIIADVYNCFPTVVLHDESGAVVKTISYEGYDADGSDEAPEDCFEKVRLTDDYVWLLYNENGDEKHNSVFVVDYEGNAVARLKVGKANSFCVDQDRQRLITVNPGSDSEMYLMSYPIPDLN